MIEQLQSFVAVVDAGSFSSASRRLGVPKSTISQRVQQLEQHLGVLLLQRSTRAVRPTDTGRAYYERCIRIIAEIADAELVARGEQAVPSGVLRVHLPIELGMYVLGSFMAEFAMANPSLSLELELTSRHIDLIEEGYDAAIRIGTMPNSSLISRKIFGIKRSLYASPAYVDRRGRPSSLDDLKGHSCLRFHTDYYAGDWVFGTDKGPVRLQPTGALASNNLTVLRDAAIQGMGIALLPRFLCRAEEKDGRLVRLLETSAAEDAEVFVLYPSRRHLSAKVRGLLTFLDRKVKEIETLSN